MDFSSYISRGFGFFFHPNRSNSALLIGSRYKSAVMWVRSGISKRRKRRGGGGEEKRRDGRDKFTDRKGARTVAVCWDAARHFSVEFYRRLLKWHRACRYYSHDSSFLSVFFQSIVSPSFHYLFSPLFSFFFLPLFKFYYSHFIQLIDRLFLSFKLNQA